MDSFTEKDVAKLAEMLEESIQKSDAAGTEFAYRQWAHQLLTRLCAYEPYVPRDATPAELQELKERNT